MLCTLVKTPEGIEVKCEFMHFVYNPKTVFPDICVKAIKGSPFWPLKYVVVPLQKPLFYVPTLEVSS